MTNTKPLAPTDAELTAIYKAVNGEDTGKAQPLTTQRIFRAMRAAITKWGVQQPSPASQGDALDAACQRACMELPEGMSMAIQLERNAGWIELHGSYGDQIELLNADGSLAEQVHQAIDAARAAQKGKK